MAVDAVRQAQRALQVDALADPHGTEGGLGEGFRRHVDLELPPGNGDRREAGPADRNAVADLGAGQVEVRRDGQPPALGRRANRGDRSQSFDDPREHSQPPEMPGGTPPAQSPVRFTYPSISTSSPKRRVRMRSRRMQPRMVSAPAPLQIGTPSSPADIRGA